MKDFLIEILAVVLACWIADLGIHLGKKLRRRGRKTGNPNYVR